MIGAGDLDLRQPLGDGQAADQPGQQTSLDGSGAGQFLARLVSGAGYSPDTVRTCLPVA